MGDACGACVALSAERVGAVLRTSAAQATVYALDTVDAHCGSVTRAASTCCPPPRTRSRRAVTCARRSAASL